MSRTVLFEGQQHSFPDDVSDLEISEMLMAIPPKPANQGAVRNIDNYFAEREKFISTLVGLSTRDKNLARGVYMSPQETAADESLNYTPVNFKVLEDEIAAQKNPASKKILLDEQARLNANAPSFGMILGIK